MDQLRSLFEELGFANVATFIASGNVIFDTSRVDAGALERTIERHLRSALGYDVATFLRTPAQLVAVARQEPFPAAERAAAHALYIAFLPDRPGAAQQRRLDAFRSDFDDFAVTEREVFWLCRRKLAESGFSGALLEKTLGMPATIRNRTTVAKLAEKYGGPQ